MSDIKDQFARDLARAAKLEQEKADLGEKELLLRKTKVDRDLEIHEKSQADLKAQKSFDLSPAAIADAERLVLENNAYFEAARNKLAFVCSEFDKVISFFRKNLITFLAPSGQGKSMLTANIVQSVIKQVNSQTRERRRVLVISNEETANDVYNRVACLISGWEYTHHGDFSDAQIAKMNAFMFNCKKHGILQVIDDNHCGVQGVTTSLEGIKNIFQRMLSEGHRYDAIVIDYFQSVTKSKNVQGKNEWEIQAELIDFLDQMKNLIDAPIVILAQVRPPELDKSGHPNYFLEPRMMGSKRIKIKSTDVIEMRADPGNLQTDWIVHKSRHNGAVNKRFSTGYDKGKIVSIDREFLAKVEEHKYKKELGQHIDPVKSQLKKR